MEFISNIGSKLQYNEYHNMKMYDIIKNSILKRYNLDSVPEHVVVIETLETPRSLQRKGYASELLNKIINSKKHCLIMLCVAPMDFWPSGNRKENIKVYKQKTEKLISFYKKFGFEELCIHPISRHPVMTLYKVKA
jgi:ribosomal protein S18 acetylase RimI-like enzyme